MIKKLLLTIIIVVFICGCSSTTDIVYNEKQVNFLTNGIWLGSLPCADCEAIDYQLNLKSDYTYKQKMIYKGKSSEQIVDAGNWSFVSDSIIELESYDYGKLFLISSDELIMLDQYGDRIKSEFEAKYHLGKDLNTVKKTEQTEVTELPVLEKEKVEMNPQFYQEKYLKGIEFFARGNEPFWTLEMDLDKSITFTTLDDIKLTTPAVEGIKAQDHDVTLYRSKTESGELIITVIKDYCQDNMSGEEFLYKVRVEAKTNKDTNYKTFEGCGKYLYDIRLHDIWVLEELTGFNLKKEKLTKGIPQFEFNLTEMRFSGHSGCNNLAGGISVASNKITFGSLMATLIACPNMKIEKALVDALNQKTVTYSIDKLKLTLSSGKTKMVLQKID